MVIACRALLGALAAALLAGAGARAADDSPAQTVRALASAPELERRTLDRLLEGGSWPRRAIAAMRLERYGCSESEGILAALRADEAWQVRAFAVRTLGRRGAGLDDGSFTGETEPRVLRTAMRHGYHVDTERLGRGIRYLTRSGSLEDNMLAVELAIACGDETLVEDARETLRRIILRMNRVQAGSLSPRLAAVTGQPDLRRHYRWRQWLRKAGRRFPLVAGPGGPEAGETPPGLLAALDEEQFAALEGYIDDLSRRAVDLAICLDCTASMGGELADAQGGIDDLMLFAGDVVESLRVAVVAYRDRRDEFETVGWDFTADIDQARRRLWSLMAAGGGDTPEAVYPALSLAYKRLSWDPSHARVLILVGDAPPHAGLGAHCVWMAERAAAAGLITHTIEAETRQVKHFAEIAGAGGGRCVSLPEGGGDSLIVEIAGLTLGERFDQPMREFFRTYLDLCR